MMSSRKRGIAIALLLSPMETFGEDMQAIRIHEFVGPFPETRQFIPIVHFESWLSRGRGFLLSYLQDVQASFPGKELRFIAIPAYKFVRLESGHDDSEGLIGRVKTREELDSLNPDIFRNTVQLGNTIYHTELGYVGELRNGNGRSAVSRNDNGCYGCRSLSVEDEVHSIVYRCSRFSRVIFAEFSRAPGGKDVSLFPLSRYCLRDPKGI